MNFINDTKLHEMTCIKSDGIYRHYRFKKPRSSAYYFDIITFPGYLTMTGDMGTWVFSRVRDMLHFFNKDYIDHSYWAEKLQLGSCRSEIKAIYSEVDVSKTLKSLNEELQQWKSDISEWEDDDKKLYAIKESYKEFSKRIGELKSLIDEYSSCGSVTETTYSFAVERSGLMDKSLIGIESPWDWEALYPSKKPTHGFSWACEAIQYASQRILNKELAESAMDKFLAFK